MERFFYELNIPYYDCDPWNYVKPNSLIRYMTDTSMRESRKGMEEADGFYVIYNWRIEFLSYPRAFQDIRVETFATDFKRSVASRNFICRDDEGKIFCQAASNWFYMDKETKKPKIIDEEARKVYNLSESQFQVGDRRIDRIDRVDRSIEHVVDRYDIDGNFHMNNAIYFDIFLSTLDIDSYRDYSLKESLINYQKEIKLGTRLVSLLKMTKDDGVEKHFIHELWDEDRKTLYSNGKTKFIKKEE